MKIRKTHLKLSGIEKRYGDIRVLQGLNLTIYQGDFVAIVGKSGCGKSTLLRLVAGLEKPDKGSIEISGKPLSTLNQQARMMFQDGRLLPWKRVLDNVTLGLKGDCRKEAIEVLESVGLKARTNEWPEKLSGGQQQRVALARALIHKPEILLLDEPLGALDALTRMEMQRLIEKLWIENKFTALFVTHDVEEAVTLADRVILLKDGKVASDIHIPIPRPRQKSHPAYSSIVDHILSQIIGKTAERSLPKQNSINYV
jgi:sulfonate transport system ATP-binding protein